VVVPARGRDLQWRLEPADEFDPGCVQEQRTVAFLTEEHARETLAFCILASTAEEVSMEVLYERCCGIDVHKSSVAACILLERGHKAQKHLRRFGCTTRDLRELAEWLRSFNVRHVAMESTGVYWKPVWNVLEEHFHMVLANAQHIRAVPGRKTDMMDCQWIAELLRHGLLRGSCVPSPVIRDLRDLTRTRATLSQEQSGVSSRIQKLLESANIKLASTVTHTMGKSGQAILDAIASGEDSPERLADLALGKLRSKIPQLQLALDGRIRDHHRFLLDSLLRQYRFFEAEIHALDTRLEQLGEQHPDLADAVARWITVPGVERVAAWTLVAEIGSDMTAFPSAAHLASWAGLCPGNHESAGKRLSGGDYFDQLHAERLKRHLVKRLESLGVSVTLQPQAG
jgi:transposase